MKIILLKDEKKLGKKGDIIEASDGYARNYILPKGVGVEATPANMNTLKLQKQNAQKVAEEKLEDAKALAEKLSKITVRLPLRPVRADVHSDPFPPKKSQKNARLSTELNSIRKRSSSMMPSRLPEPTMFRLRFIPRLPVL